MGNYFECKIRYEKTLENGLAKKVTEAYIVEAMTFTEAEGRIVREISPFIRGEYTITDIKRSAFSEIFKSAKDKDDKYFKCKLNFVTLDEKSGEEKKTAVTYLVEAADLRVAVKYLDENMKGSMADYQIGSMAETGYMDVFDGL